MIDEEAQHLAHVAYFYLDKLHWKSIPSYNDSMYDLPVSTVDKMCLQVSAALRSLARDLTLDLQSSLVFLS